VCEGAGRRWLLFFRGVGEGLLLRGVGQQTGDELVGQLIESEVDLGLQGRQGSGIVCQLFAPERLLGSQVRMNEFKGLVRRRDGWSGLRVEAEAHGKSFPVKRYLLE
jgi:hypothetical protein